MSPNQPVCVSVIVPTYNHKDFIADALDSILAQEVAFPYEILIGDDCSTDGTRELVLDYQARWSDRITVDLSERNTGDNGRALCQRLLDRARGRYVAVLEGDDYWTSPHKLSEQVALLERHRHYALCFHDVATVYEAGRSPHLAHGPDAPREASVFDLLVFNFIPTGSVMYRRLRDERLIDTALPDLSFHILHALHGPIAYIPKPMGVYRVHQRGLWGRHYDPERREWAEENWLLAKANVLTRLATEMNYELRQVAFEEVAAAHLDLVSLYNGEGRHRLARRHVIQACRYAIEGRGVATARLAWRLMRSLSLMRDPSSNRYDLLVMALRSPAVGRRRSFYRYAEQGSELPSIPPPARPARA